MILRMNNSYRFFQNSECEYFPCHETAEGYKDFNCLFCFCPLYALDTCPGTPKYKEGQAKDCTGCVLPHNPERYFEIIKIAYDAEMGRCKEKIKEHKNGI